MAKACSQPPWLVILELAAVLPTSQCFKVLGAGLSGTGLQSLASALRALGFRCYRGPEEPTGLSEWGPLMRQKSPQLLQHLAHELVSSGYDAILDWPLDVMDVLLQLLGHFPDARVILTMHEDSTKWFSSLQQTQAYWYYYCWAHTRSSLWELVEIHQEALGLPAMPADHHAGRCVAAYEQHNAMVREAVPPGHLLEMHLHSGWEPLCSFLNVSKPNIAYPADDVVGSDFLVWDTRWFRLLVMCRYGTYVTLCGALSLCLALALQALLLPRGSWPLACCRRGLLPGLCLLLLLGLSLLGLSGEGIYGALVIPLRGQ